MTETATTEPQEPNGAPEDATEATEDTEEKGNPANREAAKYRTKLREAEAERDTLASRLEAMQRAEVTRLAGEKLDQGSDVLEIGGAALEDLLDEAGGVNAEAVESVVSSLLKARPGLARKRFQGTADGGARGDSLTPEKPDAFASAAALIRGRAD